MGSVREQSVDGGNKGPKRAGARTLCASSACSLIWNERASAGASMSWVVGLDHGWVGLRPCCPARRVEIGYCPGEALVGCAAGLSECLAQGGEPAESTGWTVRVVHRRLAVLLRCRRTIAASAANKPKRTPAVSKHAMSTVKIVIHLA